MKNSHPIPKDESRPTHDDSHTIAPTQTVPARLRNAAAHCFFNHPLAFEVLALVLIDGLFRLGGVSWLIP